MRDTDRHKVYEAGWELEKILELPRTTIELCGSTFLVPDERKFGQVADIQRFVDAALEHVGSKRPVHVRVRKGQAKAHYQLGEIAIPEQRRWAMREAVVLHELAHHLAPGQAHGPEFRKQFVNLLDTVLAPEAGQMLRFLYWERGLEIA